LESIDTYKLSKSSATFFTFFLSSLLHELVMVVLTKKIKMYFFLMQMIQIPLISLQRLPVVRKHKMVGNAVFWIGMYGGPPLLAVAYLREQYANP
jgi:sterol O-acyltransferase